MEVCVYSTYSYVRLIVERKLFEVEVAAGGKQYLHERDYLAIVVEDHAAIVLRSDHAVLRLAVRQQEADPNY